MPDIVGKFDVVYSTMEPLDAHITHLRHLARPSTAKLILSSRYKRSRKEANRDSILISGHIEQALEYYDLSRSSKYNIRPMLQYYSYLNLAVATILAYRPNNYQGYRKHGVEDLTYKLDNITLSSNLVQVRSSDAIPLFNSIISSKSIEKNIFRLNELVGGIPFLDYELLSAFKKKIINYEISERIIESSDGEWVSEVSFNLLKHQLSLVPNKKKIENSMPILKIEYKMVNQSKDSITYQSIKSWTKKVNAEEHHKNNCLKIINFGGHQISKTIPKLELKYFCYCLGRKEFLPTLTASLLLSFSFASLVRYRPILLKSLVNSRLNLLFDVFTNEIDGYLIPSFRNLLYREELFVRQTDYY